ECSVLPDLGCAHALLLQGPAGPFFRRFAVELRAAGVAVTKVNLHAGDELFYPGPDAVPFRGGRDEWPAFVRGVMRDRGIDALFVFGDCRPYHQDAITVAREMDVDVWVFEEGYLRPDYITLERHGVNGFSSLPRDPEFYRAHDPGPADAPVPVGATTGAAAWWSTLNALAYTLRRGAYPRYEHHRPLNAWKHTFWHVRGGVRKVWYQQRERGRLEEIMSTLRGRYFFVPLQVHCDFQMLHSPYGNVLEFVDEVVATFAEHAIVCDHLVLKHHPMDRAYREYGAYMRNLAKRHSVTDRLWYVHDLHLPTLLRHAKGTITINSTVGLSSIHHGTPVLCKGTAVYDMPGLAHQGSLVEFFRDPGHVDESLYLAFRHYLEHTNQANGSVWKRLPGHPWGTGVRWFPHHRVGGKERATFRSPTVPLDAEPEER
ncbi:MAG: capsule biosynthesis protein, partial [Myxococcota bacterium]